MSSSNSQTPGVRSSSRLKNRPSVSYAGLAHEFDEPYSPATTPAYIKAMNVHPRHLAFIPTLSHQQCVEFANFQLQANHRLSLKEFLDGLVSPERSENAPTPDSHVKTIVNAVLSNQTLLDALIVELAADDQSPNRQRVLELISTRIHKELKGVENIEGMGRYDPAKEPEEYTFASLKERIWKSMPLLRSFLVAVVGKLGSGMAVDLRSFGGCFITIVAVLAHFTQKIKCSSFNTALAIYLQTLGIKRRCMSVLHGLGLVPAYQTVMSYSAAVADIASKSLKTLGREHRNRIVIVWDNFDYDEKVHCETLRQKSEHFCATTGLVVVSDSIPPEGIPVTDLKYDILLDQFDLYEAPGNQNDDIQHKVRMYFFFEALKYNHPEAIETIFENQPELQPTFPYIERLEPKITTRFEMGPIMENEGTISGTLAVMNQIMLNVLGYKQDDPQFGRVLQLTYGDQKTVSLVHSVKQMRKYSEDKYERFESFLACAGLFHFKMNFTDLIYAHYGGDDKGARHPSSVKHNEHHMGIAKGTTLPFHHKEDVLIRCYRARVLAMMYDSIKDTADVDTKEPLDIKEHLSKLSPREFLSLIEQLVESTFSRESLSDFRKDDDDVDQVHGFMCQFLDTMTTYLELKHAIKYGDIGFLRRLFPRLAVIFAGSAKVKYCQLSLYMTWLTSSPAASELLQRAVLSNSLVNTSGKPHSFFEMDRLNEYTNYKLKLLMRSRSSTEPLKDLFRRMSLSSHYNAVIKSELEDLCGENTNRDHQERNVSSDIYRLAYYLHSNGLVKNIETGRKSDFVVTNLVVKGVEALPDKIAKFNDIYALEEDDDDHIERSNDDPLPADHEAVECEDRPVEFDDFTEVMNPNERSTFAELSLTPDAEQEDI